MCSQANSWAKFCLLQIRHYLKEGDAKLMSPRLSLLDLTITARDAYAKWIAINGVPFNMFSSVLIIT